MAQEVAQVLGEAVGGGGWPVGQIRSSGVSILPPMCSRQALHRAACSSADNAYLRASPMQERGNDGCKPIWRRRRVLCLV